MLHLKRFLKATIDGFAFDSVAKIACVVLVIEDDDEEGVFQRAYFCFLTVIFPALQGLRFCDSNHPAMDKIWHIVSHANCALKKSPLCLISKIFLVHLAMRLSLVAMRNWLKALVKEIKINVMKYEITFCRIFSLYFYLIVVHFLQWHQTCNRGRCLVE